MSDEKIPPQNHNELSAHVRAMHLLDREAPPDYLEEWTNRIAAPLDNGAEENAAVIIFRLGSEWLALTASVFQEVAQPTGIRTVPHRRGGSLLGLVNVRGELLLCISLATVLNTEIATEESLTNRTIYQRLLVINRKGQRLAFLVDEIFGVHRYNPREQQEVPATLTKADNTYTKWLLHWNGKTVGALDDEALLADLNRSFS